MSTPTHRTPERLRDQSEDELLDMIEGGQYSKDQKAIHELQRRHSARMAEAAETQATYARTVRNATVWIAVATIVNLALGILLFVTAGG